MANVLLANTKIFVGGLPFDTSEDDVKAYFEKFGEVTNVNIKINQDTNKSRGFGFVTFATADEMNAAIDAKPHTLGGRNINIEKAKAPEQKRKVFLGGLPPDAAEEDVKAFLSTFGVIEELNLPFDRTKNERKNFGFVTFEMEESATNLMKEPKRVICGKECDMKKVQTKPKEDGYGGGFGGGRGGGFGGGRGGGFGGGRGGRGMRGGGMRGGGMRGGRGRGGGGYGGGGYGGGYDQGYGGGYDGGSWGGGYDQSNWGSGYDQGYGGGYNNGGGYGGGGYGGGY
ncbi:unnamed protein product [Owenia fusiformis]|uniref:Uncharacterized protein n=1 Tax=Owenia fusiformis TaxID=6347 RepID=A0A8J1TTY5_OWEFU|nr:unnamed protein product [Owenia fusiformis]